MYVKAKRGEIRSALRGPLRARPGTDGKLLSFDTESGQVEVQAERLRFKFPSAVGNMSSPNGWPPRPLGSPFSFLKIAFVSDGSFSTSWVIEEGWVAHTKCAFYRGAEDGATAQWPGPRPEPRSPCDLGYTLRVSEPPSPHLCVGGKMQTPRVFMAMNRCPVTVPSCKHSLNAHSFPPFSVLPGSDFFIYSLAYSTGVY